MQDTAKGLFVGIKISPKLQTEFDSCAPDAGRYFKENRAEYLQIVTVGEERLIGRFVKDGFPASDIDNVSRNVRSIVQLIAPRHDMAEDSIRIYVISGNGAVLPPA